MLLVSNATEAVAAQLAATRNTDACISCHVDSCLCEAAAEHGRVLPGSHEFAPVALPCRKRGRQRSSYIRQAP